jgi:DNA-binding MarR family transcriptional regulator
MAEPVGHGQVEHGVWWPLWQLLRAMDDDIARIYADAQVTGLKPSWVMELLRLHEHGPMTITELAESVDRTHSAASQKVAAMRAAGFVRTTPGADARSKKVTLTAKARRITGLLAAEWQATEAALAELEAEIPYPLSQAAGDVEEALRRKSFYNRISAKLPELAGLSSEDSAQDRRAGRMPTAQRIVSGSPSVDSVPSERHSEVPTRPGSMRSKPSKNARTLSSERSVSGDAACL